MVPILLRRLEEALQEPTAQPKAGFELEVVVEDRVPGAEPEINFKCMKTETL
jgi:hypothetical protein